MSQEKNASISNTIKNTRERHTNMICKTYEVKVVMSKLSCIQFQYIPESNYESN